MGVVLAWTSGRVGTQLPQTSPAAENVGALAAAALADLNTEAASDYKAIDGLMDATLRKVNSHRSPYAGVRRQIRGRAKAGFAISWCPGHVAEDTCESAEDLFKARGNDAADRVAKAEVALAPQPSQTGTEEYSKQTRFLQKYIEIYSSSFSPVADSGPNLGPP